MNAMRSMWNSLICNWDWCNCTAISAITCHKFHLYSRVLHVSS
jgi:hypothetical protein